MKRNLLVIAGLAVLSTSAFASKARMEALGQGTTSYYLMDSRSVFVNPAALNEMKNYVVTEWGTASTASDDSSTAPKAEGGFFREMGAFNYGLYLGNNGLNHGRTGNSQLRQDNAIDLFLAGDMGVKWGARLHYANSKDETTANITKENSALGIGLGAIFGNATVYLNTDLSDKSSNTNTTASSSTEWKQKPSINVGASYSMMGMTMFVDGMTGKADATASGTTTTQKWNSLQVGVGKTMEINPTARVIGNFSYYTDSNYSISGFNTYKLPLVIGLETDATSWLTLRGSVSQNVIIGSKRANGSDKRAAITDSTAVNGGATLNFGKLKVDGVVGTTAASRTGSVGSTNSGVLTTDNLMTRVGLTYNF